MKTLNYQNLECVEITNGVLSLLVTRSVGPRVISLRLNGGANILAELPDQKIEYPGQEPFTFYGGHRLWLAPEDPPKTYLPDDEPVDVTATEHGCRVVQPPDERTGVQKSIVINLAPDSASVTLQHQLTNCGDQPVTCAPWAITQFPVSGIALVQLNSGLTNDNPTLPNRNLVLWPYTDVNSTCITWGNELVKIEASTDVPLKVGTLNPGGWLAYWRDGVLFVKRAAVDAQAIYSGYDCTTECYCNKDFLELETIAPITTLQPGESARHDETWCVFPDFEWEDDLESIKESIEPRLDP